MSHTILIADDEAALRMLVRATLDTGHLSILEASDGETALRLAREARPDLILLDWSMPGLTGLEVAQALHSDPATADLPIVMLTARALPFDQEAARDAGVAHYMTKPFSPRALLDLVRQRFGPEALIG
ncbi:MAG: response regulator [Solirubrobacteraceae bacterium]|nr:response regulator [Solirubrobacteraceae bacterium]